MYKVSYMGNGTTKEFYFNFPYFESSNIIVTKNGAAATGFSVIGTAAADNANIPYTGGKVVFATAPIATDSITISRSLPLTRIVDYQPTAKIDPGTLNQDMTYTMEVLKDFKDKFDGFDERYAELLDNESIQTISAKIDTVTDQITDFETEITNGRIMSRDDFYSYTTNCITSIPQDIKLELNNGTLTLKSGSKLYIPNGIGKFETLALTADKTATQSANDSRMYFYNGSYIEKFPMSQCHSGATEPSGQTYMFWYDTVNNLVKMTTDGGTTWTSGWSLPFCIATASSGAISSIDKTFNGFGYIGSTIFALPGVSGLIPNGRNIDGTLRNNEFAVQTVLTFSDTSTTQSSKYLLNTDNIQRISGQNYIYDDQANYIINKFDNGIVLKTVFATTDTSNGIVSNFVSELTCNF